MSNPNPTYPFAFFPSPPGDPTEPVVEVVVPGLPGPPGPPGPTGAQGVQGPAGVTAQGPTGPSGPAGTGVTIRVLGSLASIANLPVANLVGDAYLIGTTLYIWTSGAVWTTNAVVAGPQGIQGVQGPVGSTGAQGVAGATGAQGPVGPTGATGSPGTLVAPTWVDAVTALTTGWTTPATPSPQHLRVCVDALSRVQWNGVVTYTGPGTVQDQALVLVMAGLTVGMRPSTPRTLPVVELSNPSRIYRLDIGIDGSVRVRQPLSNTTGSMCLDGLSWVI